MTKGNKTFIRVVLEDHIYNFLKFYGPPIIQLNSIGKKYIHAYVSRQRVSCSVEVQNYNFAKRHLFSHAVSNDLNQ